MITQLHGDCLEHLDSLAPQSVQTCVTSPPYWRLRKYTDDPREIGQEPTYQEYVATLVRVFDGVWRILRDDGTLWLNLGDAYANDTKWGGSSGGKNYTSAGGEYQGQRVKGSTGLPPKSLMGLPWRVAFALQDQGWVLRSEIIWEKPNGMCEPVEDRPTRTHEHVFLFAKQGNYFYDHEAIKEPGVSSGRKEQARDYQQGERRYGVGTSASRRSAGGGWVRELRNARTIWRIPNQGLKDEHYAPYPEELPRRCILAGSRPGDTILDPFAGSGTTLKVAESLGRHSIGIDLGYQELQERRTSTIQYTMEAYL